MTLIDIINNTVAGGLLGSLGQGIRIAVGLKKLNDSNSKAVIQGNPTEPFSASRLITSIFIGFVAGALGMLLKNPTLASKGDYSTEAILTIIALGYSGADFIEGVFNTYVTKFSPAANPVANLAGNAAANPAANPASPANPLQTNHDSTDNSASLSYEDIVG